MSGEHAWLEAVLPPPQGELVVAVSGGPDSAFLAWAMCEIRTARLVHVHHGTPASDMLAGSARALAQRLGRDLEVVRVVVPEGPSWEDQARTVRYAALRHAAGDAVVATAHHRDDQAETVVANLMRGAGSRGLAAMLAPRSGWVRPLLDMTRSEILAAVTTLELPHVHDPTNRDRTHTRTRIRHEVVPALEGVSPGVVDRLVTASQLLFEDDAELERRADALRVVVDGRRVVLSPHELTSAPRPVAARAVRRAIRRLDGTYPGTSSDVDTVLAVAAGRQPRATIGGDVVVAVDRGRLSLSLAGVLDDPWDAVELTIPGRVVVGGRWVSAKAGVGLPTGARRVALSTIALEGRIVVRPSEVGDRIDIGGGSKLVSDALREAAIAVQRRSLWPVVDVGGRIVWLVGVRAAAWARARSADDTVMFETGAI